MSVIKRYKQKNICNLDVFKAIVASSTSFNEIREKMIASGYDNHSLSSVKKRIQIERISTDHLLGTAWNKNSFDKSTLIDNNYCSPERSIKILISERGNKCECCGQSIWLNHNIPLEIHHIDGDKLNNSRDNLVLLCPNCHALTDNYRGRNSSRTKFAVSDDEFAEALASSKNVRQALIKLHLTPKGANYSRAYDIAGKYKIKHILEHL